MLYRIITDAGHFGSRCNKRGATKGCCDLCWYLKDVKVTESTHHVFHECPYAQIATCGMYRAFIGTVGSDDERRRTQQTPTATLSAQLLPLWICLAEILRDARAAQLRSAAT